MRRDEHLRLRAYGAWACTESEAESRLLAQVARLVSALGVPDRIVLVSSAEIAVLAAPSMRGLLERLRLLGLEPRLVAQACVGFYAAALDAGEARACSTLALFLETPREATQGVLDAVGLGAGGLGFEAQTGIGVAWFEKSVAAAGPGLVISRCEILAQERGLLGTSRLASRLADRLRKDGTSVCVSFAIASRWSEELAKALVHSLKGAPRPVLWLPSAEHDHRHLLTLKPLFELVAHAHRHPELTLTTLGAGGRLGIMRLGGEPSGHVTPTLRPSDGAADLAMLSLADDRRPFIRYAAKAARGIDNLVFTWDLSYVTADSSHERPSARGARPRRRAHAR